MPKNNPFVVKPLQSPSFIQTILRRQPRQNAIIEINNALARAHNIRDVTQEDIRNIADAYRIDLHKEFHQEVISLYRSYLQHVLSSGVVSEEDRGNLVHLLRILGIDEETALEIHKQEAGRVFGEAVKRALDDQWLDDEERESISRLVDSLGLPHDLAQEIYSSVAGRVIEQYLIETLSDHRFSPQEEQKLEALRKNLNVEIVYGDRVQALLDKFRLLWRLENEPLPVVPVEINLQRGEQCYFACNADWYEYRRTTRRVRYGGPSVRVRIAKGVYWRMGDIAFQPISEDILTHVDTGRLFLTNKRLVFVGPGKVSTIRLSKILEAVPYRNGVAIIKDTGKIPFLSIDKDADVFLAILTRVLQDYGS